jgi:hypothetical protein
MRSAIRDTAAGLRAAAAANCVTNRLISCTLVAAERMIKGCSVRVTSSSPMPSTSRKASIRTVCRGRPPAASTACRTTTTHEPVSGLGASDPS